MPREGLDMNALMLAKRAAKDRDSGIFFSLFLCIIFLCLQPYLLDSLLYLANRFRFAGTVQLRREIGVDMFCWKEKEFKVYD